MSEAASTPQSMNFYNKTKHIKAGLTYLDSRLTELHLTQHYRRFCSVTLSSLIAPLVYTSAPKGTTRTLSASLCRQQRLSFQQPPWKKPARKKKRDMLFTLVGLIGAFRNVTCVSVSLSTHMPLVMM